MPQHSAARQTRARHLQLVATAEEIDEISTAWRHAFVIILGDSSLMRSVKSTESPAGQGIQA